MDKILLTMDSEQVNMLAHGIKKYHYSRSVCKKEIKKALIYVKYPTDRVVGECDIADIMRNTPDNVWSMTSQLSGLTKEKYDLLYENCVQATAYELKNIKIYKKPKNVADYSYSAIM